MQTTTANILTDLNWFFLEHVTEPVHFSNIILIISLSEVLGRLMLAQYPTHNTYTEGFCVFIFFLIYTYILHLPSSSHNILPTKLIIRVDNVFCKMIEVFTKKYQLFISSFSPFLYIFFKNTGFFFNIDKHVGILHTLLCVVSC